MKRSKDLKEVWELAVRISLEGTARQNKKNTELEDTIPDINNNWGGAVRIIDNDNDEKRTN